MNKNFKATKTVLALAVAGLISSGVFAADIANVTIGQGGVLTVTGAANGTNSAAGNSVADGDVAATDASNTAATIGTDAFANPIDLTINGGSLTVKANAESATGNGVLFIDDLTIANNHENTINLSSAEGRDTTVVVGNADEAFTKANVTLYFSGEANQVKIRTDENSGTITLGHQASPDGTDHDYVTEINVAQDTNNAIILAGLVGDVQGTIDIENVLINNNGLLTFEGKTINANGAYENLGSGVTQFTGALTIGDTFVADKLGMRNSSVLDADPMPDYTEVALGNVTVFANGSLTANSLTIEKDATGTLAINGVAKIGTATIGNGAHTFAGKTFDVNTLTIGGKEQGTASFTASKGKMTAGDVTVSDGGTLNVSTSSKTDELQFSAQSLTVTKSDVTTATAGALTVGGDNGYSVFDVDAVTVEAGSATFKGDTDVAVETLNVKGGTASIQGDVAAEIGSLAVDDGATFKMTNGTLNLTTLTLNKAADADSYGKFDLDGGTLMTTRHQLITVENDVDALVQGLDVDGAGSATIKLSDAGDMTLDQWNADATLLKTNNLEYTNAKFWAADQDGNVQVGTKLTWNEINAAGVDQTYFGRSDIVVTHGTAAPHIGGAGKTVGSLELKKNPANTDTDATSFAFDAGDLTIRGNEKGEVFTNFVDKDGKLLTITVNTNANLTFGELDTDAGTIANKMVFKEDATIAAGTFTFDEVSIDAGKKLSAVDGSTLSVSKVTKDDTGALVADGATVVNKGEAETEGANNTPTGYMLISGNMTIENGGLYVAGDHLAAAKTFADDTKNVLYIGEKTSFAQKLTFTTTTGISNEVVVDMKSVANAGAFDVEKDSVIKAGSGVTFDSSATLNLVNLDGRILGTDDYGHKYLNVGTAVANLDVDFGFSDIFAKGQEVSYYETEGANDNGKVKFVVNEDALSDFDGFMSYNRIKQSLETVNFNDKLVNAILFDEAVGDRIAQRMGFADYDAYDAAAQQNGDLEHAFYTIAEDDEYTVTNMALLGGAFSTAVDINNEVWNALDRRMTLANLNAPRAAYGVTPWVDVIGTTNEAKDLFGGAGYEADIYGAVLGADWTAPCGAIVGAALSIGQADANSSNWSTDVDNDVDFWGISLYGSHQIGSFNGKIDIGYISTSNDLSTNTVFGSYDEDLDGSIFTMGLGAEYLVKAGSLNVVPHAGIRWSRIDLDDGTYASYDAMNLFQMPMGVTFSGTFDMTGWKVAPMLDLSVVPAFGDKDAVATYTGGIKDTTRVVDTNPIQMTLGVNAQVDAWTFGVNYGLTAGGDERLNNSFNLNARYTF